MLLARDKGLEVVERRRARAAPADVADGGQGPVRGPGEARGQDASARPASPTRTPTSTRSSSAPGSTRRRVQPRERRLQPRAGDAVRAGSTRRSAPSGTSRACSCAWRSGARGSRRSTTLGVPTYDELVLAAGYDTVQHDGAMLRRFIQALQRGHARRAGRPAGRRRGAAQGRAGPRRSASRRRASRRRSRCSSRRSAAGPFGFQNLEQWQEYADWMRRNDLLTQPVDVGTLATNEFLPGEGLGDAGGARRRRDRRRRPQRALPDGRAQRVRAGEARPAPVGREQLAHLVLGRPRARMRRAGAARRTSGRPRSPAGSRS